MSLIQNQKMELKAASEVNPDSPNLPLGPGDVLQDRYRIVRQLGRGGMGAVYEAVDQRLGITVALKETLSSESSMRKQFELEARLLAGMQHPALPRVSDHFVEGSRACLVMQYIAGVDLATIISQQPGPFPRDRVIAWADQLLDALIYLHSRDRQVIHRDIKPHNLKLTATGQIALLDFGLAKAQRSEASVSSAFFGYTRHYAPLEQIQDQQTDQRSDIYALGATLYHLLTGVKPADAMVRAAALVDYKSDPLRLAHKIHEAVGPEIAAILNKAMAPKPEDRYTDASEFREALRRMGRTGPVAVRDSSEAAADSEVTFVGAARPTALKRRKLVRGRVLGLGKSAAVIVTSAVLLGGVLFGSHRWLQAPVEPKTESGANTVAVEPQPMLERNSVKSRATARPTAPFTKATSPTVNKVPERKSELKQVVLVAKSQPAPERREQRSVPESKRNPRRVDAPIINIRISQSSQARNRIDAPSVRLPSPEVRDNVATPSLDSGIRAYGSSSMAPKFYRAADGTQTVKFSDGTTRVVRPGQRSAELK